jgi:flagellar motility protein MotE (MotC chaperone)
MKKTQIILLAVTGVISFAATFGVGFILKKNKAVPAAANAATPAPLTAAQDSKTPAAKAETPRSETTTTGESAMSESQLKTLIYDLRQKMQDYKDKQKELEQEAQRIEIARQGLQEEVEQLNQLREKLNLTLSALQEKERTVRDSLIKVETVEKTNLQRIAATYDKMDPAQAGKILATMVSNSQTKDAVKILYYMSERNAGKLLGEIGAANPETAGMLSLQLKQVEEQK